MDREDILDDVARRAGIDSREGTERVVIATLTTLGEHVSAADAQQIARRLPPEISDAATSRSSADPESPSAAEFVRRVASREGGDVDETTAARHVRATMATLAEAGVGDELRDAREHLPEEFGTLFDADDRHTE